MEAGRYLGLVRTRTIVVDVIAVVANVTLAVTTYRVWLVLYNGDTPTALGGGLFGLSLIVANMLSSLFARVLFPVGLGVGVLAGGIGTDLIFLQVVGAVLVLSPLGRWILAVVERRAKAASDAKTRTLLERGVRAVATILTVDDTGVTTNDNPDVRMRLRIAAENGDAFEVERETVVSRLDIPRPGRRYPAWYLPDDRTQYMIVERLTEDAPAAMREWYAAVVGSPSSEGTDPVDEVARLWELRQAGALNDDEYERLKARAIEGVTPPT